MQSKKYNLQRFIDAQKDSYDLALFEIKEGCKLSHWMWYIFPQIAGLGHSARAQKYAIADKKEAVMYMQHPVLGPRLIEASEAILALPNEICPAFLGWIDTLKLCSCMTLFAEACPEYPVFEKVLDKFYAGEKDEKTLIRLL